MFNNCVYYSRVPWFCYFQCTESITWLMFLQRHFQTYVSFFFFQNICLETLWARNSFSVSLVHYWDIQWSWSSWYSAHHLFVWCCSSNFFFKLLQFLNNLLYFFQLLLHQFECYAFLFNMLTPFQTGCILSDSRYPITQLFSSFFILTSVPLLIRYSVLLASIGCLTSILGLYVYKTHNIYSFKHGII